MEDLNQLRGKIDIVDEKLAMLIEERMEISKAIGAYKKAHDIPVFDPIREEELKKKNVSLVKEEFQAQYLEILETILKVSKDKQL